MFYNKLMPSRPAPYPNSNSPDPQIKKQKAPQWWNSRFAVFPSDQCCWMDLLDWFGLIWAVFLSPTFLVKNGSARIKEFWCDFGEWFNDFWSVIASSNDMMKEMNNAISLSARKRLQMLQVLSDAFVALSLSLQPLQKPAVTCREGMWWPMRPSLAFIGKQTRKERALCGIWCLQHFQKQTKPRFLLV